MKLQVYNNKPQSLCYGCRACEQICGHDAITMINSDEGFLYPNIDPNKCVECGLCEKVCPTQDTLKDNILHKAKDECYAAWNVSLDDRLKSTSGGMFYVMATKFITDGGVVYGASMNDALLAYQRRVDNIKDLDALRGSKYMQSDTNHSFSKVKKDLLDGTKVLYSGTPCQIAGLKLFLRKEYKNLYTIDLVCHGVPSPMIFAEHLRYINKKEGASVSKFYFRGKKLSGWRAYVSYELSNGKKIQKQTGEDFYFNAFCLDYFNRRSCFSCEYSCLERVGDVTLSDFWGGERFIKELKKVRKHGYNLVICNTSNGEELFGNVDSYISKIKCDISIAQKGDVRLRNAEPEPLIRDIIYKEYRDHGYEFIANKYASKLTLKQKLVPNWLKNIIREIQSRL